MASEVVLKCATCSEPATNKCGGCSSLVYCCRYCQTKDWPNHKIICRNTQLEKTLVRVTDIVQTAYFTFRENTWDTPITTIEEEGNELLIYDGDQKNNATYFVKFPIHLIKNKGVRMAVLTAWMCAEPLAFMHNLIMKLLDGSYNSHVLMGQMLILSLPLGLKVKVHEVQVNLKNIERKTTAVGPGGSRHSNWPNFVHEVLHVKSSKTGRQWLIDISGGQFGICQAFWKWEDYEAKYVERVTAKFNPSTMKILIGKLAKIPGNPTLAYELPGQAAAELDQALAKWTTNHMVLSDLIKLKDKEYEPLKRDLLRRMDEAVSNFIKRNDFTALVKTQKAYEAVNPRTSIVQVNTTNQWLKTVNLEGRRPVLASGDDEAFEEFRKNVAPGTKVLKF
ncbi:hypothetical protein N0V83_009262 [Neocucurbitaria cava]|uniref:MYND-type domain-containing protein n=1 Tax=Neocucurbitaria cava TaxID=798079 RepID=A0A9W9CIT3_9PLEO|nr:hypothetical protein N0V83_009262 [Neocucurbitaria cava]